MDEYVFVLSAGSILTCLFLTAVIITTIFTIVAVHKQARNIQSISTSFPASLTGAGFSEIPLYVAVAFADYLKVPVDDVIKEYKGDSMKRHATIVKALRDDELTKKFTSSSIFVAQGYSGVKQIK